MRIVILIIVFLTSIASFGQDAVIKRSKQKIKSYHKGIRRCERYDITSNEISENIDGLKIAFITDIHFASKFTEKTLRSLENTLRELNADIILMGGDYQEGCEYVEPLFNSIMKAKPQYAFGVLGNNDYERCTQVIVESMDRNGIKLLENNYEVVAINGGEIAIAGAKNTFGAKETIASPTSGKDSTLFTILMTHTPDYIEDVDCKNTDLALAGHLHGGQVTLFRLYAPILPSHYGQRFRTGLKYNSQGIPIIISNGIGTSRKKIRFGAPSEVQLIVLHSRNNQH